MESKEHDCCCFCCSSCSCFKRVKSSTSFVDLQVERPFLRCKLRTAPARPRHRSHIPQASHPRRRHRCSNTYWEACPRSCLRCLVAPLAACCGVVSSSLALALASAAVAAASASVVVYATHFVAAVVFAAAAPAVVHSAAAAPAAALVIVGVACAAAPGVAPAAANAVACSARVGRAWASQRLPPKPRCRGTFGPGHTPPHGFGGRGFRNIKLSTFRMLLPLLLLFVTLLLLPLFLLLLLWLMMLRWLLLLPLLPAREFISIYPLPSMVTHILRLLCLSSVSLPMRCSRGSDGLIRGVLMLAQPCL